MERKGEKRKQQVFDTAARLFAERGYSRTSIRDLSQALDLQKSSLYYYFESKEELLFLLLNDFMDRALEAIDQVCGQEAPPLEKLAGFMRVYTSFYAGDRHRLSLLVNDLDCLGPKLKHQVLAKERRYLAAIKGILSDLKQAGLLRDLPISVAVFAFFGMVHYTPKWYSQDGSVSPEELGRLFQQIFCQGVLQGPLPASGQGEGA